MIPESTREAFQDAPAARKHGRDGDSRSAGRSGPCAKLSHPRGEDHRAVPGRRFCRRMPRLVGDWLSRKWKQPVVIENRPGAAGNIGTDDVFKAKPDGYTLLSAPPPPLVINQNLYAKLSFDPAKFEPIILISRIPNSLMVIPKNVPAKTLPEFIARAKAEPARSRRRSRATGQRRISPRRCSR